MASIDSGPFCPAARISVMNFFLLDVGPGDQLQLLLDQVEQPRRSSRWP